MSATDELRAELTKRGVKWEAPSDNETWWETEGNNHWSAEENGDGKYLTFEAITCLTPAQAIAATLGSGTCHNVVLAEMDEKAGKKYSMAMTALRFGGFMPEDEPAEFECSACRETAKVDWETLYQMDYCPFCGARIVEVES